MNMTRKNLEQATEANIITKDQAESLYHFLKHLPEQSPTYNFTNVLYYLGGMIAIGAMTVFMNLGWETFGGLGLLILSLLYGILGLCLASIFDKKNLLIPAGICATFVVCLTPLAIYGVQLSLGWWPSDQIYRDFHRYVEWHWILMEFGTLLVGIILAWIYRYPFLVMPIAFTLWYMSMDLTSMLTGGVWDFNLSAQVSMYFGFLMLFIAIFVDIRSRSTKDYAFWLYLFGVMAFWGGLSMQYSNSELGKLFYCFINILMIGVGVLLIRKVFVVFGAIGITAYIGHLATSLFSHSVLFPVILTFIGFMIIYLGILWQKYEQNIAKKLHAMLPQSVRELFESRE